MIKKKSVELPTKNYQKIRVEIVDNNSQICPHFYNLRILNQFLKLLKKQDIKYTYYREDNLVIVDQFHLVIKTNKNSGRFFVKNKACRHRLSFFIEAASINELLIKLIRYKIIAPTTVSQITGIRPDKKIVRLGR